MELRASIRWKSWGCWLACALLVLAFAPAVSWGASEDKKFVAGLRERRLFALAAGYCQRRLQDENLAAETRAELVVALSQTLVEHALEASPNSAVGLWQQAIEETATYVDKFPDPAWAVVVRAQAGLVLMARGEMLRQQAEVASQPETLWSEARGHLRLAIRQLRGVEEELAERLRDTRIPPEGAPTRDQLLALQKNLRYQLARAYLSQGQCYPAETADRDNALRQSVELLHALAQLATIDPLVWQARLDEAKCLRLLGDRAGALRKLAALAAENPPPAIAMQAQAQRLRVLLDNKQFSEAQPLVQSGRAIQGVTHPDWDYALLEYCLAMWTTAEQSKNETSAKHFQDTAASLVKQIEADHSPYWARRAESLLASKLSMGGISSDLELKVRAAQGLYRSGQWQDAVAAYESAAATARVENQLDRAFELDYAAAAIAHEQNQHMSAATKLRRLALASTGHRQAAEAHLLAVFHSGQAVKADELPLEEYEKIVREHLERWPDSPTTGHAQVYLGNLHQHAGDWDQAIQAYAKVRHDHPEFAAAVSGSERAYRLWIATQKAGSQPHEPTLRAAADFFERLVLGPEPRWPALWSAGDRAAALAAARLRLEQTPPDFDRAARILEAARQGQPPADEAWQASATAELTVAYAGLKRFEQAEQLLDQAGGGDPRRLLDRLEQLGALAKEAADGELRQQLARLQLAGLKRLGSGEARFDDHDQWRFDRLLAQATADSGDFRGAVPMFERLLAADPRDGDLHEALAECLTESDDQTHWQKALSQWRDLERKCRPGDPRWFRAKYGIALTNEKLGHKEHAVKLIKVTAVLHPELGGSELKTRFEELLKRCEGM